MSGTVVGELILWLIVAIVVIAIVVYIVNWLYHRSSKEVSFVRTGLLGERVVINGGAFVLPFIHDYTPVNMNVQPMGIVRSRQDAVITRDLHDEPIEKPRAATRITDAEQKLRRPHAQVLALRAREAATEIGDEIRSAGAHGICRCAEDERVRDDKLAHARRVPVPDRGTEVSDDGLCRGRRFAVNRFARAPMFHRACPLTERAMVPRAVWSAAHRSP